MNIFLLWLGGGGVFGFNCRFDGGSGAGSGDIWFWFVETMGGSGCSDDDGELISSFSWGTWEWGGVGEGGE